VHRGKRQDRGRDEETGLHVSARSEKSKEIKGKDTDTRGKQKQQQQKDQQAAAGGTKKKKVTAAQLRVQKGKQTTHLLPNPITSKTPATNTSQISPSSP